MIVVVLKGNGKWAPKQVGSLVGRRGISGSMG